MAFSIPLFTLAIALIFAQDCWKSRTTRVPRSFYRGR